DLTKLEGWWELRLKDGKRDYILQLEFTKKGTGRFNVLFPTGEPHGYGPADFNGMAFSLRAREGKRFIAITDCLAFPEGEIEVTYELKGATLILKGEMVKNTDGPPAELNLSGTWKRPKD